MLVEIDDIEFIACLFLSAYRGANVVEVVDFPSHCAVLRA